MVSNGKSLVIKTNNGSYYRYPIARTPLDYILDKKFLIKEIKNLSERIIDNKFIKICQGGIADAAVFNEQDFHFVEFKTNAEGNNDNSVQATYSKAMSQLKETLSLFENNIKSIGIDFKKQVDIECNIIVSESFPRNNTIEMTYAMQFAKMRFLRQLWQYLQNLLFHQLYL